MRQGIMIGCALAAWLAASPAGAMADDGAAPPPNAIEDLRLSAELARAGERRGDPWLLAAAARLRRATPVTVSGRTPEGGQAVPLIDPTAEWIAEARRLGRYERGLKTVLDQVERQVWRGRAGGPKVSMAVVAPDGSHRYVERFAAATAAAVYIEGDGDTDLVLKVLGEDGAPACEQTGPGDVKVCSWRPSRSGVHTIQVINTGPVANSYALATN